MCMSVIPSITGFKYFNFCPTHSAVCLVSHVLVKLNCACLSILQICVQPNYWAAMHYTANKLINQPEKSSVYRSMCGTVTTPL